MMINKKYINQFILSTERAAYGASLFKGKNDKIAADQQAVDEMRSQFNRIDMNGRIVIGEGELDDAPMLFIGEKVGTKTGDFLDIAVDPLEGTNFLAQNLPNALSVMAATEKDNLFHAPETYMEKIAIGSGFPDKLLDLDNSVKKNIKLLAESKNTSPKNLTACLLKRPRHNEIIRDLNEMGVNIKFITDGDVSGVISVADPKSKVDIYLGIGGSPEGVLSAAALSCLNGQMQSRLVYQNDAEKISVKKMGIFDLDKKYYINDLIKGDVIFCTTGVTDGELLKGIKDLGDSFESETLVLHKSSNTNKKITNIIKK